MVQKADQVRMALVGANGRMGSAIQFALAQDPRFASSVLVTRTAPLQENTVDVIVDFSTPEALPDMLAIACRGQVPYLVGTTNLTAEHHALLDKAARQIPILQTANTSVGMAVLEHLVRQASALLTGYDVEVHDRHHRHKKDAPSGTALMLGQSIQNVDPARIITFSSTRGGGAPGDHTVSFLGADDAVTITHQAFSRTLFAKGALDMAVWLVVQPAGRYQTADFLNMEK